MECWDLVYSYVDESHSVTGQQKHVSNGWYLNKLYIWSIENYLSVGKTLVSVHNFLF